MLRGFLFRLVRVLYRFRGYNVSALNVPGPVLLLPNHVSWWDWVFIGACLEEDWRFVTSSATAALSRVHRWIMVNRRTFPIDINSPFAVKHLAEYLQKGGRLVLFPEGRISTTGSLMKLFDGTGFLIFKTHAKVITAYIRGAHRLPLSHNPDRKRVFSRVSVHFSDVLEPPALGNISVTAARARLTEWLREQMMRQRFEAEMKFGPQTVPEAIMSAARQDPGRVVLQDVTLRELSYGRLRLGARLLAQQWGELLGPDGPRVGVLLPNASAMPVTLLSLWLADRVPAVLNYTTGPAIMQACARLANLKQIITSRAFVERAGLELKGLRESGIEILFLEDVRHRITTGRKLAAWLGQFFGGEKSTAGNDDVAVVLFTSGSEGDPKGVELTHRNLLANIHQMLAVIDLMDTDRFFNALPLFHSFGLTVGLLLPLVQGIFVFLYLSPLHYRVVPSAFYNLNCTVFFGTNTFLAGYARKAHPYDFRTLRYVFAGAEKLQERTSNTWMQKFGIRVLEGYGATECSPCLAVNVPMRPRPGSAGEFLPGIEYRLEHVEGINTQPSNSRAEAGGSASDSTGEAAAAAKAGGSAEPHGANGPSAREQTPGKTGRLFVRGPNVMRGYLNTEANARFQALQGWYDTGDIVKVDADGFVHILGRLKRFAKVSGEMVSLTAVEDVLAASFPQFGLKFAIAVVARPDEAKGEKLIAVTNEPKLTLDEVRQAIRGRGLGNLAVPRELKVLHELPRLGSGKVNHRELEKSV
jgi:acyl-[acyl-carrier-protein]-phospholipid O-acyltransferase/long-chain-fatty-acid--[acyl-carrier-protein] ligase